MVIEMSIAEVKNLLSQFVERNLIEERERTGYILDKIISSGSDKMKENFIKSLTIGIYVTDVLKAETELKPIHIKKLFDPMLCLLFIEILNEKRFFKIESVKDIKLKVFVDKYIKKEYEVKNYFNNLLISFSNVEAGITLNQKLIEASLSGENKKDYVKGVRELVTTTLTGKSISNSFVPHKETIERIVLISELGKYLNIGEKNRILECPVCKAKARIDKENLTKILEVVDGTFTYKCTHSEDKKKIGENFFKMNVEKFFEKKHSAKDKSMFILNNFKRLTDGTC